MSTAQPPVFVDDTGRRRILTRRAGRVVVIGFTAYLGLVVLGFTRDPRVGAVHLPTFGLPSLALTTPPAPAVLGEQATGTAAGSQAPSVESQAVPGHLPGGRASLPTGAPAAGTATPVAVKPPASARGGRPATPGTTTSPTTPPSTFSPTTTAPSTPTTSSTTTTTSTMPGQGQRQGAGSSSAKGPDGSGPPGQERKTTTTTAG